MNPTDILFQSISNLTGGLITDLTTAIVGVVVLAFIGMGIDLLISVIQTSMCRDRLSGNVYKANHALQKAKASGSQVAIDIASARYRSALSKFGRGAKEDDC